MRTTIFGLDPATIKARNIGLDPAMKVQSLTPIFCVRASKAFWPTQGVLAFGRSPCDTHAHMHTREHTYTHNTINT